MCESWCCRGREMTHNVSYYTATLSIMRSTNDSSASLHHKYVQESRSWNPLSSPQRGDVCPLAHGRWSRNQILLHHGLEELLVVLRCFVAVHRGLRCVSGQASTFSDRSSRQNPIDVSTGRQWLTSRSSKVGHRPHLGIRIRRALVFRARCHGSILLHRK